VASPEVKLLAAPVIRRLEFASPWSRGGKGWDLRVEEELQLSWAYAASGELGKAQDAATRALRLQRPQSVTVAADLGQIIRLRQFTPEQTWAAFDDAMKGNDQAGGVMLARAYAHLLNQQPKEAAEWITRSLYAGAATDAVTQLQAVQLRLVLSQIGAESPGEALKMADAGLAARPDSVELRHARALATSAMGNMDDAITQALAIVQDEPRYRPVMDLLVMWYEQRGQPEEAARWFERSKALVTGATH
jgi:tetratricopeptide (TPR) repeat protein